MDLVGRIAYPLEVRIALMLNCPLMNVAGIVLLVSDRRYADPQIAMTRFLESANGLKADQGRIPLGAINRTMLDEGASVGEYSAARDLAHHRSAGRAASREDQRRPRDRDYNNFRVTPVRKAAQYRQFFAARLAPCREEMHEHDGVAMPL